jgi:sugar phosphate isomerase/epimerase
MIETICTPCRAAQLDDLKIRLALLEKVGKVFPTGIEVVGTISDFSESARRKAIRNNVAKAKSLGVEPITIHSPVERKNYRLSPTNLSKPGNVEILQKVFDLANQIEAKVVTIHCEAFHSFEQMKGLTDLAREGLKEIITENLKKLDKGSVLLAIENIPWPLMGDVFYSSAEMIYDPLFADPLELYQFAGKENLQITFDTCHWATLCLPIPLLDIFQKIEDRVCQVHLSDAYGRWLEGTAIFEEGVIPGQGNLDEDNFRQLLSYLKESKKSLILTLEVKDKDYRNPKESQKTLTKVLNWLRE